MQNPFHTFPGLIAVFLASMLIASWAPCYAQTAQRSQQLAIEVVQGQGAALLSEYIDQEPIKVVIRLDGKPVKGALVRFEVPASGPGGYFLSDGSGPTREQEALSKTDKKGRAAAKGFKAGKELGDYTTLITASYGGQSVSQQVKQTVVASGAVRREEARHKRNVAIPLAIVAVVIVALACVAASGVLSR